ncbi:MAG: acyl-CoA dehydrogenase [Actinomycetia bacterium]|nr:acyl-CoA dehydrogenase [Actinomycetes bacterium]
MSELAGLLVETAERMFAEAAGEAVLGEVAAGRWPEALWRLVEEGGFLDLVAVADPAEAWSRWADALAVLRAGGRHALPVPLAEALWARRLSAAAGFDVPAGYVGLATGVALDVAADGTAAVAGEAAGVPWAREAVGLVVVAADGNRVAWVARDAFEVRPATDLAFEPRDTVRFSGRARAVAEAGDLAEATRLALLSSRVALMAGALERVLELTVAHAQQRTQFGRPLGRFQAIQQAIAMMAADVALSGAAADELASAAAAGRLEAVGVLAAKVAVAGAAGRAAAVAHQVHGAMGFTEEYRLHYFTQRLWSWRDEYGTETELAGELGRRLAAQAPDALWPALL